MPETRSESLILKAQEVKERYRHTSVAFVIDELCQEYRIAVDQALVLEKTVHKLMKL